MLFRLLKTQNKNLKNFSTIKEKILNIKTPYSNISPKILNLVDEKIYLNKQNPLGIIKLKIQEFFENENIYKSVLHEKFPVKYTTFDNYDPIVNIKENFDDLETPKDHVSRKKTDTYYISETHLLRPHTSVYQIPHLKKNLDAFTVFGFFY